MKREAIVVPRKFSPDVEQPYGYIYITTCLVNHKKYVGQHIYTGKPDAYLGSGTILKKAIEKYGKENFVCEPIDWATDKEELNQKECWWIDYLVANNKSNKSCYNLADGGHGGYCGVKPVWSDSARLKMSKIHKGKKLTPHQLEVLIKSHTGNNHSNYGKHLSEDTKEKISKGNRGKVRTAEFKARQSEYSQNNPNHGMKGKKHSDDSIRKMSTPRPSMSGNNNPNYGNHSSLSKSHRENIQKSLQRHTGKNNSNSSSVIQLTLEGEFVREYECIRHCKSYGFNVCCVSDCCRGLQNTTKGYIFMYKDDYINKIGDENNLLSQNNSI